jgi:2-oxoglutarate dehydrogenase complex dehydrogenase (E1) component-like enzyme
VIVPLLLTSIYAAIDAAMLMWTALSSKELEHGGNTPKNLATKELFQLDTRLLKFSEAMSYQDRIEKNHRRNEQIGFEINRGIKMACATPLIYLLLLLVAYLIALSFPRP